MNNPLYDWSEIPEKYNWVAVDEDEGGGTKVWGYEHKPAIERPELGAWTNLGPGDSVLLSKYVILRSVDWKDSLEQRPGTEKPMQDGLLIEWDEIPLEYNWAALDQDGSIWLYKRKPINTEYTNRWTDPVDDDNDPAYYCMGSTTTTRWEDSLVQRPGTVEEEEPVQDGPLYDWSKVPETYKWIAVDELDERPWGFEFQPAIKGEESKAWNNAHLGDYMPLDPDIKLRDVNWKDSLEQRPRSRIKNTVEDSETVKEVVEECMLLEIYRPGIQEPLSYCIPLTGVSNSANKEPVTFESIKRLTTGMKVDQTIELPYYVMPGKSPHRGLVSIPGPIFQNSIVNYTKQTITWPISHS